MPEIKQIAIIGGGLSGTALSMQLLRQHGTQQVHIHLIEKSGVIGRGVAYETSSDQHLLNVPASKMSIWPEDAGHFHRWLQVHHQDIGPMGFAGRKVFGDYIQHTFQGLISDPLHKGLLSMHHTEVIGLKRDDNACELSLSNGETLRADAVVLAIGNFPPAVPKGVDDAVISDSRYFNNPWNAAIPKQLQPEQDVLIIGSGLTMVDIVCMLKQQGHQGRIHSVSTHGFVPQVHEFGLPYPDFISAIEDKKDVLGIYKVFRKELQKAKAQGINWRAVIDAIRPHTQEIWQNLPARELERFVTHIRHIWGVARHRMPPENAAVLEAMLENNQLQLSAGRVRKVYKESEKFILEFTDNTTHEMHKTIGDVVINCTGPQSDYTRIENALLKNLFQQKMVRKDVLNMGFDTTVNAELKDAEGKVVEGLYTIGPPMKGVLWEITAVPEIRVQAQNLASGILAYLAKE